MTCGAMRATHLTLVKLKRKQKRKEREKREKNGEKEKRGEREGKWALPSFYDLRRSGSRFSVDQELNSEYVVRATRGY